MFVECHVVYFRTNGKVHYRSIQYSMVVNEAAENARPGAHRGTGIPLSTYFHFEYTICSGIVGQLDV